MKTKIVNEITFTPDEYARCFNNQMHANELMLDLHLRLTKNSDIVINELKKVLGLDYTFDIKILTDSILTVWNIVETDCEVLIYIDIAIYSDGKNISKGEQMFFYIFNNTIKFHVINSLGII